ncbi:MAG: hypothetical protein LBQ11_01945 [Candidatus Nomurabacteria bacterium]|jgi:hypothetical protein|nr:hypothetical protein [Candidatus Nomurabacteria bacterium]
MVEFIKSVHKRGVIANVLHALFNVAYAATVMGLIMLLPSTPWPALALVLVSKWRVVAVRPRYWWANILSNLPDMLLGLGVAIIIWMAAVWQIQVALAVLYAAWLIILKPQHRRHWVMIQAGVSQFVALSALFAVGHSLPLWAVVILTFIIGFSIARQVLVQYDEKDVSFLSLVWGLLLAELSFVAWHWTIAYQITPTLRVAQFAIIAAIFGFVASRGYAAWHNDGHISWNEMRIPVIFASVVLVVLLFMFSGLWDATTL